MSLASLEGVARILILVLYFGLILKLWRNGLGQTYRFFFYFLIVRLCRSLLLAPFSPWSDAYAWIWACTEPLVWVLFVLVVLELYSLVLRDYKGMASLGRWILLLGLGVSILISLLSLFPDMSNTAEQFPRILYFTVIQRGLYSSLAIFLLIISAFLVGYPVPLNRNIIIHVIAFSSYFLPLTLAVFIRNVAGGSVVNSVNMALLGITIAAQLIWLWFLSPAGEKKTMVLKHRYAPADEARMVEQLSAINSTLLRVGRKADLQ